MRRLEVLVPSRFPHHTFKLATRRHQPAEKLGGFPRAVDGPFGLSREFKRFTPARCVLPFLVRHVVDGSRERSE